MKTNIPIYRAKKIDGDEWVKGSLIPTDEGILIWEKDLYSDFDPCNTNSSLTLMSAVEIDPATLAINFPDMLDSEDTPIFASLSEDGRGGDQVEYRGDNIYGVMKYSDNNIMIDELEFRFIKLFSKSLKAVGIQK